MFFLILEKTHNSKKILKRKIEQLENKIGKSIYSVLPDVKRNTFM